MAGLRVLSMTELERRYQHQPWCVKLFRCRWYLMVPLWTLHGWLFHGDPWSERWSISVGSAHGKMGYWYTAEETEDYFREKL